MVNGLFVRGGADMYCGGCGNEIPDSAQFCGYCGTPVSRLNADEIGREPYGKRGPNGAVCVGDRELYRSSTIPNKFKTGCILAVVSCAFCAALLLFVSFMTVETYASVDLGGTQSYTSNGTTYVTPSTGMGTVRVSPFSDAAIVGFRLGAVGVFVFGVAAAIGMYTRGRACSVLVKDGPNPGLEIVPLVSIFSPKPAPIATFVSIHEISQIGSVLKVGEFRLTLKSGKCLRVLAHDPDMCQAAIQSLYRSNGGIA